MIIMKEPIHGVIVPTLTFFKEDGSTDIEANRILIHHVIANDADVLFLMGSTGEGLYFKDKPKKKQEYLRLVKDLLIKYDIIIPVIIGVYGENSNEVIKDARSCLEIFPNAGLVVPPPTSYELLGDDQIEFFKPICSTIENDIYVYNNPLSFGNTSISVETIKILQKFVNFKGLKDSSGSME